jgi:hypothetical protein
LAQLKFVLIIACFFAIAGRFYGLVNTWSVNFICIFCHIYHDSIVIVPIMKKVKVILRAWQQIQSSCEFAICKKLFLCRWRINLWPLIGAPLQTGCFRIFLTAYIIVDLDVRWQWSVRGPDIVVPVRRMNRSDLIPVSVSVHAFIINQKRF